MKFTIETGGLQGLLSAARAAVGRSSTIPVLSHVRVEALADGRIELRATDMDKDLTLFGAANVAEPGVALVEHAHLADWVKTLHDGSQVEIEAGREASSDRALVARCGRARHRLPTLDERDFPASPEQESPIRFEIGAAELGRMLRLTLPAVSSDETAYYLCGVHLVRRGEWLRSEATNKHLVSIVGVALPAGAQEIPAMIVPTASARALLGLIDGAGIVQVAASENRLVVETDAWRFASKLIEGDYPNIPSLESLVVPTRTIQVSGSALAAAVRRVAVAAELVEKRIKVVRLSFGAAEIRVSAGTVGFDDSEDAVDATNDGAPIEMAFNSAYLRDLLDTHKFDRLVIGAAEPGKPVRLREDGAPSCDCAMLMPRLG